jgi:hypothetical protein
MCGDEYKSWTSSLCNLLQPPVTASWVELSSSAHSSQTPSSCAPPFMWQAMCHTHTKQH